MSVKPMFEQILGKQFDLLPEAVRATHRTEGRSIWQGRCSVQRGDGLMPRLMTLFFGFPLSGNDVPVVVEKEITAQGEIWHRQIGRQRFVSTLLAGPNGLKERFAPFTFDIGLNVRDGALHYPVKAGRIGPVPLPRWSLPISEAREMENNGVFRFDIGVYAPITEALLVRYEGFLTPVPPK